MIGKDGGSEGVDDDFCARGMRGFGPFIMGRNMFGPIRGDWPAEAWNGWWGPNPPYHAPVYVLTHYPRPPLVMEGGTTFHFTADSIETVLDRAKEAAGGRDVKIAGGMSTVRQYLRAGLIDELHFAISPVGAQAAAGERGKMGHVADPRRQIVEVLGIGYRQQVIAALEAKGSSDALAKAAILAWQEDHQLAQPLRVKQLLDRALAIDPDDAFVRFVAATFCTGPMEDQCAQPDAAENWCGCSPMMAIHGSCWRRAARVRRPTRRCTRRCRARTSGVSSGDCAMRMSTPSSNPAWRRRHWSRSLRVSWLPIRRWKSQTGVSSPGHDQCS